MGFKMSILKEIAENKIFSRVTASSVVIGGMYMIYSYLTVDTINPEVLAVAAGLIGSAATFLFMSEKD